MKHDSDIIKRIKNYFMRRKSAAEAYEFEREIEKDAFLYEALEGFEEMHVSDIQQALDELDTMIDQKVKLSLYETPFFKAAAVGLILIVGASVFTILGLNKSQTPDVAVEEPNSSNNSNDSELHYTPRNNTYSWTTINDSIDQHIFATVDSSEADSLIDESNSELDFAIAENEISQENTPAEIVEEVKFKEELTSSIKKQDSAIDRVPENEIVMTEDNAEESIQLDEVVVMEESTARTMSQESLQKAPATTYDGISNSKQTPQLTTPTPSSGYASYQKYIQNNLKKTDDMTSGSVVVTFEFDRKGSPRKLEITKSLCDACDAEAIRLIENGPEWTVDSESRKTRVSYTIVIP